MGKIEDEYEHNSTMLYVGNLDESVSDDDLYEHLNQFPGLVVWCRHVKDSKTNKPQGYGFVNYSNPQQASIAINLLNSTLLNNKSIEVKFSPDHRSIQESNLFIENLDRSVDKNTLHRIFSNYGKILSIKMSSSGCYATVLYNCFESAQSAIEHLDGTLIRNNQVRISPFLTNRIHPTPQDVTVIFSSHSSASEYQLLVFFSKYGPITHVSETTHHKGERFGFITFENPEDAASALRDAPNRKWFAHNCEFYGRCKKLLDEPQPDLKQLHVKNLHKAITDHSFKALFSNFGTLYSCKVLRYPNGTSRGFGRVAYSTNQEASRAFDAMNGELILGRPLCITLEEGRKSRPEMSPIPLPMNRPLAMHPPGGFGLGFGQQIYPSGGVCLGSGQEMFYGQMPPTLFSPEPDYWYQQQLNPGMMLPVGAPMPNTFVPQFIPGMSPGAGASIPNSLCEICVENLYPQW